MNNESLTKKLIGRSAFGAVLGIAIGYTILTVLAVTFGFTSMVSPESPFAANPSFAIIEQYLASAILGLGFGAASVIWELDHWSLAKQTILYFLVTAPTMVILAPLSGWVPLEWGPLLAFSVIYLLVFVVMWIVLRAVASKTAKELNSKVS